MDPTATHIKDIAETIEKSPASPRLRSMPIINLSAEACLLASFAKNNMSSDSMMSSRSAHSLGSKTLDLYNGLDNISLDDSPKPKKGVTFGTVTIRKYTVVLGDNTTCFGPPLTLGWEHGSDKTLSTRRFEMLRSGKRREKLHHLRLSSRERIEILQRLDVNDADILAACQRNRLAHMEKARKMERSRSTEELLTPRLSKKCRNGQNTELLQ